MLKQSFTKVGTPLSALCINTRMTAVMPPLNFAIGIGTAPVLLAYIMAAFKANTTTFKYSQFLTAGYCNEMLSLD